MSSIAIMQPYFFPHLAYFQLIHASDKFFFYDDVNFKTDGWIHRNRILIQEAPAYITVPCRKASHLKLINEVEHDLDEFSRSKLLRKMKITYSNAPFFGEVYDLFENVIGSATELISELAMESVRSTMNYLKMDSDTSVSSEVFDNQKLSGQDRVIDICKKENGEIYINSKGGVELYNPDDFRSEGLDLKFLCPKDITYKQFSHKFVSSLSILDVMMFNDVDTIQKMLGKYQLR